MASLQDQLLEAIKAALDSDPSVPTGTDCQVVATNPSLNISVDTTVRVG